MEGKSFAGVSIPQRGKQAQKDEAPSSRGSAAEVFRAEFAEIEYEHGFLGSKYAQEAAQFFSSVPPPLPIERKPLDPIRLKFNDMRSIASDKPFARNDSELFYRQAKFMEDFTDDYQGDARLNMHYPYYQHMGYEQLRTYFTWRTKTRSGELIPISLSYMFLYIYELLANIGVKDPAVGLDKLLLIFKEYVKFAPILARYLPQWIKDYCIYYELPQSFEEFVKENGLLRHYPEMFLFDASVGNRLELWCSISDYTVTGSKFYKDNNRQMLTDCFSAVLDAICEHYSSQNARYEDLIIYRISNRIPWDPFRRALFYPYLRQSDRQVKLPGSEEYYCRNNRWTSSYPMYLSSRKSIAGFIIKKTEACLRETLKFKHRLSINSAYYQYNKDLKTLERLIENAVSQFHRNLGRTVVTVKQENLDRIRKEAQGTQDKLIVPDEQLTTRNTQCSTDIAAIYAGNAQTATVKTMPADNVLNPHIALRSGSSGEWAYLKDALSAVELHALGIALHDCMGVKAFADENDVMLEILVDGINEKAADIIGDSILDVGEGVSVFDDYRESVDALLHNNPK